jgi:hypothetical protein
MSVEPKMIEPEIHRGARGAVHPGFLDILIIGALAAILLYAAWRQFPAYQAATAPTSAVVQPTH